MRSRARLLRDVSFWLRVVVAAVALETQQLIALFRNSRDVYADEKLAQASLAGILATLLRGHPQGREALVRDWREVLDLFRILSDRGQSLARG